MIHLGAYAPGETVYIPFSTNDGSGGAVGFSATIEAADFDIYKDGSATQRSSTAGFTVSETFDSVTGLHMLAIDLSDDTDAGFYATGSQFAVSLTPDETVDSQTIAVWLATFRIEASTYTASGTVQATAAGGATSVNLPGSLNLDDGSLVFVYAGTGAGTSFLVNDYSTPSATTIWGTLAAGMDTDSEFIALPGPPGNAVLDMLTEDLTRLDGSEVNALTAAIAAIKAVTDALGSTAAGVLALSTAGIITGAAATGTLSTIVATSDLTGYADDQLIGRTIIWTSGDCDGEATDITDYASSSGTLTFTAVTTAPGDGDTFVIV